ncbi:MAG: response regulator [Chitinophagaceae bacterium]
MSLPFLVLADDDEDDRFLFSQAILLVDPSIVCSMVGNGREVMTLLSSDFLSLPDFIFLDLNMPLMNGRECLAAIRQHPGYNSCVVIIYSTTMEAEEEAGLKAAGAADCLVKPTGKHELAALLRKCCGL